MEKRRDMRLGTPQVMHSSVMAFEPPHAQIIPRSRYLDLNNQHIDID